MMRKRIPAMDDDGIHRLIVRELLPHTRRFFPTMKVDRKELKQRFAKSEIFVYGAPGKMQGFVSCMLERPGELFVDMLAVNRSSQGMGLGSKLMNEAEKLAQKKGCRRILLYVNEDNTPAIGFYEKLGYVRMHYDVIRHVFLMQKSI